MWKGARVVLVATTVEVALVEVVEADPVVLAPIEVVVETEGLAGKLKVRTEGDPLVRCSDWAVVVLVLEPVLEPVVPVATEDPLSLLVGAMGSPVERSMEDEEEEEEELGDLTVVVVWE